MGPFAMMAVVLEVIFWMALLSVAAIFLGALAKGMIEDIRDHRRIVAARAALGRPPDGTAASVETRHITSGPDGCAYASIAADAPLSSGIAQRLPRDIPDLLLACYRSTPVEGNGRSGGI